MVPKLRGKASSKAKHELPDGVVIDVLSRLPVKSHLRFKRVCKSWFVIIPSNKFTKLHLKKTCNSEDYANHMIVVCLSKDYMPSPIVSFPLFSKLREPLYKMAWLYVPSNMSRPPSSIVGSYNGVICMVTKSYQVILWNPYVRQYKRVLIMDALDGNFKKSSIVSYYGFYYDYINDDYKFVGIYKLESGLVANLRSSKTNSWKHIPNHPSVCVTTKWGNSEWEPSLDRLSLWSLQNHWA